MYVAGCGIQIGGFQIHLRQTIDVKFNTCRFLARHSILLGYGMEQWYEEGQLSWDWKKKEIPCLINEYNNEDKKKIEDLLRP